jgi:hypothetical protein
MTMTKLSSILPLALALPLVISTVACEGRDPLVSQRNRDAVIEPPPPPPPPPPPEVRTLGTKRLFGTMPAANRFEDPLMTGSGFGSWFGYANDFSDYAISARQVRVTASPTQTPFFRVGAEENPRGATILAQLKTASTPLHIEVWIGRDGDGASFNTMGIALVGLFPNGEEVATELAADESTRVDIEGRTWIKFSADLNNGPLGFSMFLISDNEAGNTFYIGGPVAADLDVGAPNTALRFASSRAVTEFEARVVAAARDTTRHLAATAKRDVRPAALPGVPR